MGAAGAEGEPCAVINQQGKSSPNRPANRGSAALLARDSPPDIPSLTEDRLRSKLSGVDRAHLGNVGENKKRIGRWSAGVRVCH